MEVVGFSSSAREKTHASISPMREQPRLSVGGLKGKSVSKITSISAMKPVMTQRSGYDSCFHSAKKERVNSVAGWTLPANEKALLGRESVVSSHSKKITFSPPLYLTNFEDNDGLQQKSVEKTVS